LAVLSVAVRKEIERGIERGTEKEIETEIENETGIETEIETEIEKEIETEIETAHPVLALPVVKVVAVPRTRHQLLLQYPVLHQLTTQTSLQTFLPLKVICGHRGIH